MLFSIDRTKSPFILAFLSVLLLACQPPQTTDEDRTDKQKVPVNSALTVSELLAKKLIVKYEVIDNRPDEDCNSLTESGLCFSAAIHLTLNNLSDDQTNRLNAAENWAIYFSHMAPIFTDFSQDFDISHVNGDLHRLSPKSTTIWNNDNRFDIPFKAGFWHLSEFDSPPNFYVVDANNHANVILSTQAKYNNATGLESMQHVVPFTNIERQFKRSANDNTEWATAAQLFKSNELIEQAPIDVSAQVIPTPKSVKNYNPSLALDVSKGIKLTANPWHITQAHPALTRLSKLGLKVSQKGKSIRFELDKLMKPSAYRLVLTPQEIRVSASSAQGAFYALTSLAGLYEVNSSILPILTIEDEPRYSFRGLHIDVARNFRSKQFILRLLDQMAAYKLNKLHLHLGDDEGWRLEIPGLPELTQIGGYRCHDMTEQQCLLPQLGSGPFKLNTNNGFYSVTDYQQILKAAKARFIDVIPSFDMPGHSRAAVKSMEARFQGLNREGKIDAAKEFLLSDFADKSQYTSIQHYNDNTLNICMESTYHFVEKIISELGQMHKQAEIPLLTYHIGADETPGAWKDSPKCQSFLAQNNMTIDQLGPYFIERVSQMLSDRQIQVAGWSDGLSHTHKQNMPKNVQANAWTPLFWNGHKIVHSLTNQDWHVVLSTPDVTYFDFPYEADPKERGYYWGSRATNTRQVFEFMPDNLPAHAEVWTDRENNPMMLDDRPAEQTSETPAYSPLKGGKTVSGIQAHLWSEMVRSDDIAAYLLFPRLLAIAERAWHTAEWEEPYQHAGARYSSNTHFFDRQQHELRRKAWRIFANTLAQKELAKLDKAGWHYRLPTVGAKITNNQLELNSIFPGLALEYKMGESPWKLFPIGAKSIPTHQDQTIFVRSKAPSGERYGRQLQVR